MRLELKDASHFFQAGTAFEACAVSGVELAVGPGERLGIAGPVGSGKSTLLMMLAGMLAPTSGSILHDGEAVTRRHPAAPGQIGFAFQSPESCLFEKTVFDDVAFAPRNFGVAEAEVRERVDEALAATGLDPGRFSARNPFSLSLGEQRRVALAGLLAMRPPVLLLDEPTAHLDPPTRYDMIERLVKLNETAGTTIVMVGHDMDELARFAERLVIMDRGSIVADGPARRLLADTGLLKKSRLKAPAAVELSEELSRAMGSKLAPAFDEPAALKLLLGVLKRKET